MNAFEHFFKPIVDVGLFTFGLANAGVVLSAQSFTGAPTWIIFLSLLVGKTVGIFLFAFVGTRLGLSLPKPMELKQVVVLGCVAGIGFTVALFVTTVAMQSGRCRAAGPVQGVRHRGHAQARGVALVRRRPDRLPHLQGIGLERLETKHDLKRAVAEFNEDSGVSIHAPDGKTAPRAINVRARLVERERHRRAMVRHASPAGRARGRAAHRPRHRLRGARDPSAIKIALIALGLFICWPGATHRYVVALGVAGMAAAIPLPLGELAAALAGAPDSGAPPTPRRVPRGRHAP